MNLHDTNITNKEDEEQLYLISNQNPFLIKKRIIFFTERNLRDDRDPIRAWN